MQFMLGISSISIDSCTHVIINLIELKSLVINFDNSLILYSIKKINYKALQNN